MDVPKTVFVAKMGCSLEIIKNFKLIKKAGMLTFTAFGKTFLMQSGKNYEPA
jgi:hypothetical protein